MGSNLSKLKHFTGHFFRKVFLLSITGDYFLLGAAVSASLTESQGPGRRETRGAERATCPRAGPAAQKASPATHPPGPAPQVAAGTEIETLLESRRRDTPLPSLPPSFQGSRVPGRPRPPLARGSGPRPALTTAALGAAAPRAARDSGPTPSSNLAAARGRRRGALPAALHNGRLGRAQRLRAGLQRLRHGGPGARRSGA